MRWNESPVHVSALSCEHLKDPMGIGVLRPRLVVEDRLQSRRRSANRLSDSRRLSAEDLDAGKSDLWDSGKVASDQSVLVPWAGKALDSGAQVFWQVRIWDKDDQPSAWSDTACFELGLLTPPPSGRAGGSPPISPLCRRQTVACRRLLDHRLVPRQADRAFRHSLDLPPGVAIRSAVADISAEGGFTFYVNGRQARQASATAPMPGKNPRARDFGELLSPGKNTLAIAAPAAGHNGIIAHFLHRIGQRLARRNQLRRLVEGLSRSAGRLASRRILTTPLARRHRPGPIRRAALGRFHHQQHHRPRPLPAQNFYRQRPHCKGPPLLPPRWASMKRPSTAGASAIPLLDPGWTDYTKRVMVQTIDVTRLLTAGKNTLGAVLGDGWYAGRLGLDGSGAIRHAPGVRRPTRNHLRRRLDATSSPPTIPGRRAPAKSSARTAMGRSHRRPQGRPRLGPTLV